MQRLSCRRSVRGAIAGFAGASLLLASIFVWSIPASLRAVAQQPEANTTTMPAEAGAPAADDPTFEVRLEYICEQLEENRKGMQIPGMAIAIVKDDEIILARGFGYADLENEIPATEETIFACGSTTKAFTAALIAMLVDEGKASWDDPVRDHLPGYHLQDEEADENVALRDVLSHRIGLAAMNMLWYGKGVTKEDVLEASYNAESLYPFREKFNYSNISYLAAGEAAGHTAGADWHTVMKAHLFDPLNMTSTNTSIDDAKKSEHLATGYLWNKQNSQHDVMKMRDITPVAPAGAINSNVVDLAQWVRLQLAHGTYDNTRLISEAQMNEMWTKHIEVAPDVDYGLGWFLRNWQGHRVIEHAGGIDGFTAEVAFIPEENVGFVLLMNLFAAPLQDLSRQIVFEGLLNDLPDPEALAAGEAEDFSEFTGDYIANFGQFKDTTFNVRIEDGKLAVDVPGQMVFKLKAPDDEGKRPFEITDQVAVRFNRDEEGDVYSLTMFQAGMEFEVPRAGVEMPVEIDLEAARKYLGFYRSEQLNDNVEVVIQNNRLGVAVPTQMVYELHPPDDEDRWKFRIRGSIWVRFNEDESTGDIASMTFFQDGVENLCPRVTDEAKAKLPDINTLMARIVEATVPSGTHTLKSFRETGTVRAIHAGVEGTYETYVGDHNRRRVVIDFGKFGTTTIITNGDRAWMEGGFFAADELPPALAEQEINSHPFIWLTDWRDSFESVMVETRRTFNDREVYAVRVKPEKVPVMTVLVDTDSYEVLGHEGTLVTMLGTGMPSKSTISDYRLVNGVMLPFRVEVRNDITGAVIFEAESIEPNVDLSEIEFEM